MKYVALMRAINVAGHASVRMSDVRDAFTGAGCAKARTCAQSGNVIFESRARDVAGILRKIHRTLFAPIDDEPEILVRTGEEIERLANRAPFSDVEAGPGIKLCVVFLSRKPRIRPKLPLVSATEALEAIARSDRDVFVVSRPKGSGFFGFPNSFVETAFGVSATSRNWSAVTRIPRLLQTGFAR
jgi:uncharacterized protein (DUF1697 family)